MILKSADINVKGTGFSSITALVNRIHKDFFKLDAIHVSPSAANAGDCFILIFSPKHHEEKHYFRSSNVKSNYIKQQER